MPNIDDIAREWSPKLISDERLEYGFNAYSRFRPMFVPCTLWWYVDNDRYRVLVTDRRVLVVTRGSSPVVVRERARPPELSVEDIGGRVCLSGAPVEGVLWVYGWQAKAQARSAAGEGDVPKYHALPPLHPAGFVPRALAFVWNYLPLLLLFLVGAVVGGLLKSTSTTMHSTIVGSTTAVAVGLGLYTVWSDAHGQSRGKRRFGVQVVDRITFQPIGPARGFLRLIGRVLDVLSYGVGFLLSFRGSRRQTLADMLARSVVVSTDRPPDGWR